MARGSSAKLEATMKIVGRIVVILVMLLAAGYYVASRPEATIDRASNPARINNLHMIDENAATGFAIYRLGEPDAADVRGLCELGISQIVVLAGTALEHEQAFQSECPSLQVIYNVEDDLSPLSDEWLSHFDDWIARAQATGVKIAFRCTCGCHRTGRLAAYYQMRYRGLSAKDAWDLALTRGSIMEVVDLFSGLQQQIIALYEHIHARPCSQGEYCVVKQTPAQRPCEHPLLGCGWASAAL
jgi:protein-tyrosine phosphatase